MDLGQTALGIGLKAEAMSADQVVLRAIVVYVAALALIRLGKKRFLARASAFDVIVGIVIGSIAARAVTGNAPLSTSLAGIAAILAMHWLFSFLALRWRWFGTLIKGRGRRVIRDGRVDEAALRREHMSDDDLAEDLRAKGHEGALDISDGRIERSGRLSVVPKPAEPGVLEVAVREGVQTVRIVIDR